MEKGSKILVTGCQGMSGWRLLRELSKQGYTNAIGIDRSDCNLVDQKQTLAIFEKIKPDYVFHIAAKVGGIYANTTKSGEYTYENMMIQCNVIESARVIGVKKLLFCGSGAIYPKDTPQPYQEESILTGPLEQSNIGYVIAKISGMILCQMYNRQYESNFITVLPSNIYGIGDNFNIESAHVIPGLIHKIYEAKISNAKSVEVWGTGESMREFIYADDVAKGMICLMENYNDSSPINIGTGKSVKINYIVETIKQVVGYAGEIIWNDEYEGIKERCSDIAKIKELGWEPTTDLRKGIEIVYEWFLSNYTFLRK